MCLHTSDLFVWGKTESSWATKIAGSWTKAEESSTLARIMTSARLANITARTSWALSALGELAKKQNLDPTARS